MDVTGRPGFASSEGTRRFRDRGRTARHLPAEHFRDTLPGLALGSIGLGTYLGAPDAPTDLAVEEAVSVSVMSGRVNVVDTAINYRYQRAERSVGRALARLFAGGKARRDEVLVSTKNGYLAPDAESGLPPSEYLRRELYDPGVLRPEDVVERSHSMAPGYLADQFERSRRNLGLDTIDLLYLHNAPDAQLAAIGRPEFLDRLRAAFALYEGLRSEGRLTCYGLATWDSLLVEPWSRGYFDLESAIRVAREVGGPDHGFRFVQFPFNLAMRDAAVRANQPVDGTRYPLFEAARRLAVDCFTSVPLMQGRLAVPGARRDGLTAGQAALQYARSAPGTIGPLVGQKRPEHLSENLAVAERPPWDAATFNAVRA